MSITEWFEKKISDAKKRKAKSDKEELERLPLLIAKERAKLELLKVKAETEKLRSEIGAEHQKNVNKSGGLLGLGNIINEGALDELAGTGTKKRK